MSEDSPRSLDFDIGPLLEVPSELLRDFVLEISGASGSKGGVLMAKLLRAISSLLVYGYAHSGGGRGKLPSGLSHREEMQRATELIDLADELDGLSSAQPSGGK